MEAAKQPKCISNPYRLYNIVSLLDTNSVHNMCLLRPMTQCSIDLPARAVSNKTYGGTLMSCEECVTRQTAQMAHNFRLGQRMMAQQYDQADAPVSSLSIQSKQV